MRTHQRRGNFAENANEEPAVNTSEKSMIERIARVLAAYRLSSNAQGEEPHAGPSVDMEWEAYVDEAHAVLRAMREPDSHMAQIGDVDIWTKMIAAAAPDLEHVSFAGD